MEASRTAEMVSIGRKLVAIAVLATALAHGPLALAAPGEDADAAVAVGCGTGGAPAAVVADSGVEWSSSPRMPGEPY